MKITAAVTPGKSQPFKIQELELDEPRENEVLVRIVGTGVCHTDLVVRDQYYPVPLPAVLGHEGSGIVERVGAAVTKVQAGDHVVLSYNSCAKCQNCKEGHYGYCNELFGYNFGASRPDGSPTLSHNGEVVHGSFFGQSSFATYALAYERNVVKVPRNAPLELLGPLGCGLQTGAGAVINALRPQAGTSIAVFGTGSVGLAAVMAARVVGCTTIIGVDINPQRLEIARELGATHTILASDHDPVAEIRQITGDGAQYSLECTSLPKVFRQAVDCLRLTGVCGLIGAAPLGTEATFDMNTILFGRSIRGIIEGDSVPDLFIPRLVELYMQGRFPIDKLVKFYTLDQINQAAEDSERGDVLKPVIRMG
ncbi:MAG: NAD(P)-dependent alcohol dehydrogenase [Chloroflexi bacterium OHK40]